MPSMWAYLNLSREHLLRSLLKKNPLNSILRHVDKILRNGKVLRKYLIKFKNYSFDDAKWMIERQLKDSMALVHEYNTSHPISTS